MHLLLLREPGPGLPDIGRVLEEGGTGETAAAYTGLSRLHIDDGRFTASIDATAPGPAGYLWDASAVYARERLC